ncbi:hypothetical protein HNY73_000377 [Argiope bruennichi]|uniref:Secreted protein n=1 Tax=Argiope bruennichi TaxID=94029 RepID=A0A8T0G3W3_ARGBR|nr:hypothetical protein HNY73_000377 [Argiope bruennichi]
MASIAPATVFTLCVVFFSVIWKGQAQYAPISSDEIDNDDAALNDGDATFSDDDATLNDEEAYLSDNGVKTE